VVNVGAVDVRVLLDVECIFRCSIRGGNSGG